VARAIHAHQPKAARFVAVDCAAFDPDELERELFGGSAGGCGIGADPAALGLE
jgi:DNA-binding NtrC family response regulator